MSEGVSKTELLELTTEIVSSYLSKSGTATADLPKLITEVHKTLTGLEKSPTEELKPAVPIGQSVKPDYVVCLDCGVKQKMLKRHIFRSHSLSPDEYKARWHLPIDYPLVAPSYAATRSALAKKIGLGKKSRGRLKK